MDNLAFADFETLSLLDVTQVGAYKYARDPDTDATVLAYAFNDNPVGHIWSPYWAWPRHDDYIEHLLTHVEEGGYMVFWNAGFDRHIWNEVMVHKYGWPYLPLEQVLCAQAQAEANNLPGSLGKAAECAGVPHKKDPRGKELISLLATGTRATWDAKKNNCDELMGHFRRYGLFDVLTMRDIWNYCRPLMGWEWDEYHASERINDRGVAVDYEFSRAAQSYARAEAESITSEMVELTGDPEMTVNSHVRKAQWLHGQLWPDPELQSLTERPPAKKSPEKPRFSCDRPTRETVLDLITGPDHAEAFEPEHLGKIVEFLELIEAGNSAAVKKFTAIVNQAVPELQQIMQINAGIPPTYRVHGGYSFNGAGQTGRFSSRGIQVHNIIRQPVKKGDPNRAIDAIEDIMAGMPADELENKYKYPVSRLLARLLRPTFIAPPGKMLVWGDYDQIEARKLPWLARSTGAEAKLDLFRNGQDVYKYAASPIFRVPPDQIDDESTERQVGKVAELALGFGGGVGAFQSMGRNYGVILPSNQAQTIVNTWRAANEWCVTFWNQLWDAAIQAYFHPGTWMPAGRVKYLFHPGLMGGTLICELPCSRWLVYPQFRHRKEVVEDDEGNEHVKLRTSYVKGFSGGFGRVDLWRGKLAENVTQASAASILRRALTRVDDMAVLHTHDEIALEVDEKKVAVAETQLQNAMTYLPDWAEGLPLTASVESGPFYTK
jgi:DNA polymerase